MCIVTSKFNPGPRALPSTQSTRERAPRPSSPRGALWPREVNEQPPHSCPVVEVGRPPRRAAPQSVWAGRTGICGATAGAPSASRLPEPRPACPVRVIPGARGSSKMCARLPGASRRQPRQGTRTPELRRRGNDQRSRGAQTRRAPSRRRGSEAGRGVGAPAGDRLARRPPACLPTWLASRSTGSQRLSSWSASSSGRGRARLRGNQRAAKARGRDLRECPQRSVHASAG